MRRIAEAILVALALLPGRALAQHHHHAPAGAQTIAAHAGLAFEVGRVDAFGGARDYQSIALMAGVQRGAIELLLHAPYYRIELGAEWGSGLGDVHAEVRWRAIERGAFAAGLSLALMPPIGDDDEGLAMGHWMIMTGGFARVSRGRLSAAAALAYGGGLGGGGHAEHGVDVWPPVAPMNAHEIEASLRPRLELGGGVAVSAGIAGAAPLGDGELIGLIDGGATIALGRFELGVRVGHGLAEHPGGLRGGTEVMASF
jgi:hypothetical protein